MKNWIDNDFKGGINYPNESISQQYLSQNNRN